MKIVTLLSGGMDSATLAYWAKFRAPADGNEAELICLSFDYGQRHIKELEAAKNIAGILNATHDVIRLRVDNTFIDKGWEAQHIFKDGKSPKIAPLGSILDSALTGHGEIPEGHYADESMKATVVPNRNAIMLSIAYGIAVAKGADLVLFGAHAGDHAIYPKPH